MTTHSISPRLARRVAPLTASALLGVCVVHLIDGPGSLQDQAYIGVLELSLAAACLPLAIMLLIRPARGLWDAALALNVLAALVFVASRTVGLPGSTDDIGNWSQLLGVINLAVEAVVILSCLVVLRHPRRATGLGGRTA